MKASRCIILLLGICLLINISGCSTPAEQKEKHYLRALEYLKINDDKAAVLELKNAIQMDAKFAEARYQLGLIYLKTGNPRAAFGELQRTFSLDPKNLDAGTKVAEFYLLSHNREDCRKNVEQVLQTDPNYQDALSLLANLELIDGNFAKAEQAIDQALAQGPDNDKYYNIKGRILASQQKWAESEKLFQKAIDLNPDNFVNYRTMLMFYQQRGNDAAAQQLLDTITPKFPDNVQLHMLRANFYQKKGELDKAEKEMLAVVNKNRKSVSSRLMLAQFYTRNQQAAKAEDSLKTALTDLPDDLQLQVALADLSFDMQKFDQAQALLDKILQKNPKNGGANLIKARFLIKDNQYDEALHIISPLVVDYPKWSEPFFYEALAQLRLGHIELALQSIDQALEKDSANDRYHALAAQIYLLQGKYFNAEQQATTALHINRQNSLAIEILAKALVQEKKYDKTIAFINKLNQDGVAGDAELLGDLGIAYLGQGDKEKGKETFTKLLNLAPDNSQALAYLTALTVNDDIPAGIAFVQKQITRSNTAGHYLLLAELYQKNNQFPEAIEAYKKAQELAPGNPQAYVLSARLLNEMGKTDEMAAQYEALLKKNPDSIAGIMGLAMSHEAQGKRDLAKQEYARALELQPELPAAANNLAWLLASEDGADLGEALRLAMQAKQALPEQPFVADTLGWVHYKRKSYSLAITQFKQALEHKPDDQVIEYHLALALYDNGDKEEAIASLKKALENSNAFTQRQEAENLLKQWQKG